ncbi:hypothetical protein [Roseovarius indicus]|uniref:hypothetical protein n=1 Tax=Roseovarius indicus TaxID=540747 RepID=UPI0040599961
MNPVTRYDLQTVAQASWWLDKISNRAVDPDRLDDIEIETMRSQQRHTVRTLEPGVLRDLCKIYGQLNRDGLKATRDKLERDLEIALEDERSLTAHMQRVANGTVPIQEGENLRIDLTTTEMEIIEIRLQLKALKQTENAEQEAAQ